MVARPDLPVELTSFVGREAEMATLRALLAEHRMVTLTGPGGVGKTRLARRAAAAEEEGSVAPDGVWLVELSPVSAPEQVPLAAAAALAVIAPPEVSPLDALCARLVDARVLILLDNCEHVADASAELAERLLLAGSGVRLLVTSREPLYVAGEVTWPVPPLEPADALRLFLARAELAHPGFVLARNKRGVVTELCDRLDRLPLAVELAAAKVRMLPPEEILSRLDDRFRLLRGGSRALRRMHEALEATIGWSYELLGEAEQILFRRLSVFRGAIELGSVESVCMGDFADGDVVGLVGRLVDRSLLMAEDRSGSASYRLLESLRAYGSMQLAATGEAHEVHRGHAAHFLARAERASRALRGPDELGSLESIAADYDDLRAALVWSAAHDSELLMQLAGAIGGFWCRRGPLAEGAGWVARALAADSAPTRLRAEVLLASARLAIPFADHDLARADASEAREIFAEAGDVAGLARAANVTAWVDLWIADLEQATAGFAQALMCAGQSSDVEAARFARWGLGHVCWRRNELAEAREHFEAGLQLARQLGAPSILADALDSLGHVAHSAGDHAGAAQRFEEALGLYTELGDKMQVAHEHNNLADVALDCGDSQRARPHLVRAMEMISELATVGGTAGAGGIYSCLESFARLAVLAGQHRRALRLAGAAAALRERLDRGLSPAWQARLEDELAPARFGLGPDRAERIWLEGTQLSADRAIAEALEGVQPPREQQLTHREFEIAGLVADGLSNPDIARRLVLSARTVDAHVQNIKTKLGMHTRVELATWTADRATGRPRIRGSTDAHGEPRS